MPRASAISSITVEAAEPALAGAHAAAQEGLHLVRAGGAERAAVVADLAGRDLLAAADDASSSSGGARNCARRLVEHVEEAAAAQQARELGADRRGLPVALARRSMRPSRDAAPSAAISPRSAALSAPPMPAPSPAIAMPGTRARRTRHRRVGAQGDAAPRPSHARSRSRWRG